MDNKLSLHRIFALWLKEKIKKSSSCEGTLVGRVGVQLDEYLNGKAHVDSLQKTCASTLVPRS